MANTRRDLIRPASEVINQNRQRRNPSSTIFQFPEDMGAHAIIMNFKKYTFTSTDLTQNNVSRSRLIETALGGNARNRESIEARSLEGNLLTNATYQGSVILPLPSNLQDSYVVNLSSTEMGPIGSMIAEAASRTQEGEGLLSVVGAAALEAGRVAAGAGIDAVRSALGLGGSATQADALRAARFFFQRQIEQQLPGASKGLDVGLGNVVNPHITLAFEGMQLKTHSFEWKFSPKNFTESERIKVISNYIRYNALPEYSSFSNASVTENPTLAPLINRPFLRYPSVVDIFFMGIDQEYFYFFKRCMVNSVSLNYSPEGLAILKTGKPAFVSLSMTLTEQEIHTSEDYQGIDEITNSLSGTVLG